MIPWENGKGICHKYLEYYQLLINLIIPSIKKNSKKKKNERKKTKISYIERINKLSLVMTSYDHTQSQPLTSAD